MLHRPSSLRVCRYPLSRIYLASSGGMAGGQLQLYLFSVSSGCNLDSSMEAVIFLMRCSCQLKY